jgi:hypothetical protein
VQGYEGLFSREIGPSRKRITMNKKNVGESLFWESLNDEKIIVHGG